MSNIQTPSKTPIMGTLKISTPSKGSTTKLKKMSFASVLGAPSKTDMMARLQASVYSLEEENRDLKERLSALELQVRTLTTIATNKAKEVEAKVNKVEAKGWDAAVNIAAKVEKCVSAEIRERVLQEKNSLKVRIGGLPEPWITSKNEDFDKSITILVEALHPIHLDPHRC